MASKEERVSKLFTQLQLAGEDGDYEYGLQVIDEIIQILPDDIDALSCQLVCYIQTSDFNSALELIDKLSKMKGKDTYQYERAYCMYKMEQYEQSLSLLEGLEESLSVLDLKSQVYYRLGQYGCSVEGFRKGSLINESNERTANMSASLCYCTPDIATQYVTSVPTVTMEQCFNIATVYTLVTKDYKMAESLLHKAEVMCQESEGDEEEIERDLIPIRIQLAYTLQLLQNNEEALSIYNSVLKSKPSPLHQLTAANNIIAINCDKDIFDSKKKIKLLSNESAVRKLNRHQFEIVLFNRCLFLLRLNQLDHSRTVLQEMKNTFPSTVLTTLMEASVLYRERKTQDAIALLEGRLSVGSLSLYLMLAQLYWDIGNHSKAESIMEGIPNLVQYRGIVSVIVSLRKYRGEDCVSLLESVLEWWRDNAIDDKKREVIWEIGQFMLDNNQCELAAKVLDILYREDSSGNVRYLAYLISAYSRFDPKKAEELSRSLPPLTSGSIDVNSLEQMPTFQITRRAVKTTPTSLPNQVSTSKQKRKKKRKKRLPKNFDPKKPIDPERWIPLRERSYYRKSKKRGQSSVGKGTQGMSASMVAMAAKLDASKPKDPAPKQPPTGQSKKPPPPQKKKKKGKR